MFFMHKKSNLSFASACMAKLLIFLNPATVGMVIQGVYVLQDNQFKLLTQISNSKQYMELAPKVSQDIVCSSFQFTMVHDLMLIRAVVE